MKVNITKGLQMQSQEGKYHEDLEQERKKLTDLFRRREELEIMIARQKRRVSALAQLCEDQKTVHEVLGGLSYACRTALRASRKEWMTIREIQRALIEFGFPLDQYEDPGPTVRTVINRLVHYEEVLVKKTTGRAHEYKWMRPPCRAVSNPENTVSDPSFVNPQGGQTQAA
jgi:hypothetical protein